MSETNFINVAQRMFGTPLLIEPQKAEAIARAFGPRVLQVDAVQIGGDDQADMQAGVQTRAGSILVDPMADHLIEQRTGFSRKGNVAVIGVFGSLVRRGAWIGQSSGLTSYEGLRAQLLAADSDPEIRSIALEIESPGGEAAGAFELAQLVREISARKPVYAFCAEYAFSAAYAIASQAARIIVPEFGSVGSIGVLMMHVDQSQALSDDGIKVTIIRSGAHKAEGNSIEPLPQALQDVWQREGDKMRVRFAEVVHSGRGDRLSMADALATEARCLSADEALNKGLADQIADPRAAFDAMVASVNETGVWDGSIPESGVRINLGSLGCTTGTAMMDQSPNQEEADMPDDQHTPDALEATGTTETTSPPPVEPAAADGSALKITEMVSKAGLSAGFAAHLIKSGCSIEAASSQIIDKMAAGAADGGDISNHAPRIEVGDSANTRMQAGMVAALCAKAGLEGGERNEFSSMSLREMARFTITSQGLAVPTGGALAMVGAAFVPSMAGGMHTTSDFANVLADVANKSMLKGYREAPETFEQFTSRGTLTDFKPSKRVGMGLFPGLDEVGEDAEFTYGTVGDFGESIVLATYGKMFKITRQAIINDDLSAFTDLPTKMGRAARRTVGSLVYSLLSANAAMSDGNALFHTAHGNLAASGGAPSEATIDAALQAMATQKARETSDAAASLNITPRYLIAGYAQRSAVMTALMSEKAPSTAGSKGSEAYNTVYQAAEPIFDARIAGNEWYMAADPASFDTIEVAYLDGVSEPFLDQQDGWSVDGTEFKVRLDAGVKATAWEGLYKNPGQ